MLYTTKTGIDLIFTEITVQEPSPFVAPASLREVSGLLVVFVKVTALHTKDTGDSSAPHELTYRRHAYQTMAKAHNACSNAVDKVSYTWF